MNHRPAANTDRKQEEQDRRRRPFLYLRLNIAIRIWALWIPLLARDANLTRLLARSTPPSRRPYAGFSAGTIWRCCHRAVKRPILMRDRPCLREGLLLNRFLILTGRNPVIHFGVDRASVGGPRIKAHCWVAQGDRVFNPPSPSMIEILEHRNGLSLPPSGGVTSR